MNNKQIILPVVVLAVVIIGIFVMKGVINQPSASPSPDISPTLTPTPTSSLAPTSPPISSDLIPRCQLSGEIIFDGKVFKHTGNQEFNYQNVLDPHDFIKWEIYPSGEIISVGPNMFPGLNPIKGSAYLTISFDEGAPKYDKYSLSASIDYVAVIDNAAKILNEKCSGKTTLIINK